MSAIRIGSGISIILAMVIGMNLALAQPDMKDVALRVSADGSLGHRAGPVDATVMLKHTRTDPLPAGTYSVGSGGFFPSLDSAFTRLNDGGILGTVSLTLTDTLYLAKKGHRFQLGAITGAGPTARITIRPAPGTAVTVRGDSDAVFYLGDTKYVTFDGRSDPPSPAGKITVHSLLNPAARYGACIVARGDADRNEFLSLNLRSDDLRTAIPAGGIGVILIYSDTAGPDSNLIEGNRFTALSAVWLEGKLTPLIRPRANIIRNNTVGSMTERISAWAIQSGLCEGTLIEGNTVQFGLGSLKSEVSTYHIGINSYADLNTVIRNNTVHGLSTSGDVFMLGIAGTGDNSVGEVGYGLKIYNNVVYDLQNTLPAGNDYIIGIMMWTNRDVLVAHNSVYLTGKGANPKGVSALAIGSSMSNVTVRNNLLVNVYEQTAGLASDAFYANSSATYSSDYNSLWVGPYSLSNIATTNTSAYKLLSDWQVTGQDAHSVSLMPSFRSATDLHIDTLGSRPQWVPLANRAVMVTGLERDVDGDNRVVGNSPDIGADEFWIFSNPPTLTRVEQPGSTLPQSFSLDQNYPNPFNPWTTIRYGLPNRSLVRLTVFNTLGQQVALLQNGEKGAGFHEIKFDGSKLASGVYLYRMQAGSYVETRRLLLVR